MNENEFWMLIEEAKKKSKKDLSKQCELITAELSKKSVEEILDYDRIFRKYYAESYQSELWAAAYIINGGCSDDGFDYFRAWLIAQGREVFENALKDPESLVKVIKDDDGEVEFEDFIYIANDAYIKVTGKDDFYDKASGFKYPEIHLSWNEDEKLLEKMFPKLFKKFW